MSEFSKFMARKYDMTPHNLKPTTPTTAERIGEALDRCAQIRQITNGHTGYTYLACLGCREEYGKPHSGDCFIGNAITELERERQQVRGALKQCHDALTDGRIGTTEMDHPRFYEKLDRAALAAQAALAMLEPSREGKPFF